MSVAAWLGLPLVLYLIASGLGMAAERAARFRLADGLLAPVGACLAVLVVLPVVQLRGTAPVAAALLVLLAVAGLVLGRRDLPARLLPGWTGVAGLAGLALYLAPVVLSGHWTWLGYNFVNDTAIHLAMVDHVAEHGANVPTVLDSTRDRIIEGTMGTGYPLGTYGLLAALGWLVPVETAALYQPFIACLAGLSAMALTALARRLGVPGPAAAAIGVVAAGAGLTYQYALHGAVKEIALVLVLTTATALARAALDARLHAGAVALTGLCLAAGIGVFSAGAAAYAGALALVALVALAAERARPRLSTIARAAAVGAVALVVAVLPVLDDTLSFGRVGSEAFAAADGGITPTVYGHLVRPLPLYQSLGIWFRDDYRYPLEPGVAQIATIALLVLAGALLVVAAVTEARRRRLGALLAVLPVLLVYALAAPRLSPYADAKLLVVLSPLVVFAVAMGAWWLSRRALVAGAVAGILVAGGVLLSDAIAYHHARLAPVDRMLALRDAAEHARGQGEWMLPEWEELAKYLGGDLKLSVAPEIYSPHVAELREQAPVFNRSLDLDELTVPYVTRFDGLILRRSPVASRPPASFSLAYRNRFYELWRRDPGLRVLEHLPLQPAGQAAGRPRCADVQALAGRAEAGERLVAAARPQLVAMDPTRSPARPLRWGDGPSPETVIPFGQARAAARLTVPAGRYRVWVRGGGGRAVHASVDGREVGARQEVNTPGQWLELGQVDLAAGGHDAALVWPGGSLAPGNGYPGEIGRLVLEPEAPERLVDIPAARAAELCDGSWDWIERVKP